MFKRANVSAKKFAACTLLAAVMSVTCVYGVAGLTANAEESTDSMYFNKIASYDMGSTNADGGTAEIVHYNSDNKKMYLVNGTDQAIDIISLESYSDEEDTSAAAKTVFDENSDRIYINDIVADNSDSFASGFTAGEISSVAVNTELDVVAVAVQHSDYTQKGAVVLLDYDGKFVAAYQTGVQPDNVVFGGNYILTADEGEPREGYGEGTTDPKGSVTIVSGLSAGSLTGGTATQVYFDSFDSQRDTLVNNGVVLMKDTAPSVDLEPEYIVTSGDYAYISLQEANSIAILDIKNASFTAVCAMGFKDHSQTGNGLDLVNDSTINIKTEDVYGVYMPDGMDIYTAGDTTYLITANEGDAREWGDFSGVTTKAFTDESGNNSTEVEVLDNTKWDGIDSEKTYVLGGRSFSVFKVTGNSIEMVYDSGDGIEQAIAASSYSSYFNCNSDKNKMDARSKKKGPEPEDVTVYNYGGSTYVSVCLERQSGFVTFNISDVISSSSTANTATATTVGYTTTRDFSSAMAGDVAPENLEYVAAADNNLSKDLIIMANENSGTVAVYAIESEQKTYSMVCDYTEAVSEHKSEALITSVFGTGDNSNAAYNYSFITIYNNTTADLDVSGWTIQYKTGSDSWQSYTLKALINVGGTYTVVCAGAGGTYSNRVTLSESNYDAMWSDLKYFDNKDLSVKIVDSDGKTVDALGVYDSTNNEEGEGTLLSGISKQKVVTRNKDAEGAYVDTDNNSSDFTISSTSGSSTASDYASYTPVANSNAKATALITVNASNATVTGITYLDSGYVTAGEVSFTVTPSACYTVSSVTLGDEAVTAGEGGAYTVTISDGSEITVTTTVSHSYTSAVTAPTCTEGGYTTYTCSVCGDSYTADETEATGHSYNTGNITWTWDEYTSATAQFTCSSCNDAQTVTATITSEVTQAATCTAEGIKTYTATVTFNGQTYTTTKTETIAATGHSYNTGNITWTWNEYTSATATFTCSSCNDAQTVTATITSEVTTEATETTEGVKTYTATVTFNGDTYTNTKTEAIAATGTTGGETETPDAGDTGSGETETPDAGDTGSGETETPDAGDTGSGETETPDTGDTGSGETETPGAGDTGSGETETPDAGDTGSGETETPDTGDTGSGETETPDAGDTSTDSGSTDSSSADSTTTDSSTTDSSSTESSSSSKKKSSGCASIITGGGDSGIGGDLALVLTAVAVLAVLTVMVGAKKRR